MPVFATRVSAEAAPAVTAAVPGARYLPVPRAVVVGETPAPDLGRGVIAVLSAGTSDVPVAEEAALTAELAGNRVARIYDVGVAGLHRLVAHREAIAAAEILIVVAGMEGALPSVVAGLLRAPGHRRADQHRVRRQLRRRRRAAGDAELLRRGRRRW